MTSLRLDRRALIRVGHRCNNRCVFCHLQRRDTAELRTDEVQRKIHRACQLGYALVAFSGGEPTLRRELLSWAATTRSLGLGFGLVTNGRMLAYRAHVEALVKAGLAYAHVSLHAGSAAVHDELVQTEAFAQTLRGIQSLAAHPVDLSIGCVVNSSNINSLRSLVNVLAPLGSIRLKFALVEPKGVVLEQPNILPPTVTAAAHAVRDAIEYGLRNSQLNFAHEGFPLCLLLGHEHLAEGLRSHGFIAISNVGEDDFFPVEPEMRVYPEPCTDCGMRGKCPGFHDGYFQRHGHAELRPVVCTRSNSFTYTPVRQLEWQAGRPCPIYLDGETPYHRTRNLFIHHDDSVTLFETATGDFSDEELDCFVRKLGQVYFDKSTKTAPNDFASDVLGLGRSEICHSCPRTDRCPGLYTIGTSTPFERDDAQLGELLLNLRGTVLDVGCGTGRYLASLAPAAINGDLRYFGVDPDSDTLNRLQKAWPWARILSNRIENVPLEAESYDNIVMIGSANHIYDLDHVLSRLVMALRRGGTLLMADDVPFGLLRSASHARQCQQSGAVFEHFRVEDSQRVRLRLARLPITVAQQRDVDPTTSNQWLIRAIRS